MLLLIFGLCYAVFSYGQYEDIAPGYTKEKHRNFIIQKMDLLIKRVHLETDCPKAQITYTPLEYVNNCGSKVLPEKRLPKSIMVAACGNKLTYILPDANSKCLLESWSTRTSAWVLNSVRSKTE